MTEEEWLTTTNPYIMFGFLGSRLSQRKFRLMHCAHLRVNTDATPDARTVLAIDTAERDANGLCSEMEVSGVLAGAVAACDRWQALEHPREALHAALAVRCLGGRERAYTRRLSGMREYLESQADPSTCSHIREMFGNPFRPVAFDPAWRSEAVVGIARGIYDDRAFERMPILADALQDAGCDHPDILAHCREPGIHVRGCWVVDLVLGRE